MKYRQVPILALFIAAVVTSAAHADGSVMVAAQQAEAIVAPRVPGPRLIKLPALDVHLRASLQCAGNAESLTLSVADTVTTLDSEDLGDQQSAEASLNVPARQVALAASSQFCLEGDPGSADELTIPGLVTAHASLRCDNDGHTSAHFASAPIQVRLICARNTGEDQEPSPDR